MIFRSYGAVNGYQKPFYRIGIMKGLAFRVVLSKITHCVE